MFFQSEINPSQARATPPGNFKIEHLTDATFERDVLKADKPVYVLFYSTTCSACSDMEDTINKIGIAFNGRLKFYKIIVQNNPIFPAKYAKTSMPLSIIFHKGEIVRDPRILDGSSQWTGNAANLQYYLQWVNTVLNVINERF